MSTPQPIEQFSAAAIIRDDAQAIAVAQQLAQQFAADAAVRDAERRLPWNELDLFCASGLWGITVPRQFGGAAVSSITLAEVIALISSADGSLGQIPQNHFYALEVLRVGGAPAQQAYFYAEALAGKRFGNALAEIGHKDFKRRTHLLPDAERGGYRVNGKKFYCTGTLYAHWIPTLVVDSADVTHLAFVPRHAKGVQVTDDWDGFGQRVTGSGSVQFDHVWIDAQWLVPFKASFDTPTTIGPVAQIMHAAIDQGIARGAYAATLKFVKEHARPWIDSGLERAADDPLTLERIGDVALRLRLGDALLRRAGRVLDRAQAAPDAGSVAAASIAVAEARVLSTEVSLLAGTRLFELGGSGATLADHNLDRYWRNARTHTLHDPVRWKFHAIGQYYLNAVNPPRQGTI